MNTHNIYIKVYVVGIHLKASTCQCNSNEYTQHIYINICCWYPFEMHQFVNAIQMSTHNIYIKVYVVGTNLKCINLSV